MTGKLHHTPGDEALPYWHGHSNRASGSVSPTYSSWCSMKGRCKRSAKYRGVTIHPSWLKFAAFLKDMGCRPSPAHTLDRIDSSKGYQPGNCRWATAKEQNENRACVDFLLFRGKRLNPEDWARELGMKPQTIRRRLSRGWPVERALTETVRPRRSA